MNRSMLLVALLVAACPVRGSTKTEPAPAGAVFAAAPADAWPLARGCPAGTGRSVAVLRLPLAEGWTRRFEKTSFGAAPIVAAGTVYVGDLDGTFHALAADSGATRWTFRTEAAGFPASAAWTDIGPRPLVIVGDDTGVVRALDAATGELVWEYETEGEISGGPTVLRTAAGGRVVVGSQDASLSCLDVAAGRLIWKHSIADQIRCSPTVARTADGDRIFIAGCDGKLHVVAAADGAEIGAVPIDGPTGATPAVAADRVFFGTEGGGFFAIDVLERKVAWRKQAGAAGQSYRSSAAIVDGLAIVGSRAKAVEAFALADGERKWRLPTRGRVDASPAVALATGPGDAAAAPRHVALVVDAAGTILAIDVTTGEPAWRFDAGGRFAAGPAIAAGRVFIASEDGTVLCFHSAE
ncbi:MAG: PQQ-binding-like beta-propeller repeat protein [Planctomycetia bacterium]